MKSILRTFAVAFALLVSRSAEAGVKRALIIGIDNYERTSQTPEAFATRTPAAREGWHNLEGCVNDARAMYQLITARFGFVPANIDTMYNTQATHESILNALNSLIGDCQPQSGDIVFIYYAGHGSEVINTRSNDGTGKDQTIVPSDLWDIRDKELSPLLNKLVDMGVTLTTIFDCCHSASITRGNALPFEYVTREAPPVDFDFNDPSQFPRVEERGALVFTAAQRDQTAKETVDPNGTHHGAFTLALLDAINGASTNESAETIFKRIVANIKSEKGPDYQDPVMGGTKERRQATLFGSPVMDGKSRVIIGVKNIKDGYVELQGGFELSVYKGCRFAKIDGKDTLEVVDVAGIGSSIAKVVTGNISSFRIGDAVEMVNWVLPDRPSLLIWYPGASFNATQLKAATAPVKELFASGYCREVKDQTMEIPEYVIKYHVDHWALTHNGKTKPLADLSEKELKKEIKKNASVSLQLPPTAELDAALHKRLGAGSGNSAIDFTSDPEAANYILVGRNSAKLEYALVRPNVTINDTSVFMALPSRSTWVVGDKAETAADSITDYALRLGKLHAWMTLSSPPDEFPYHLGLQHAHGKLLQPGETVYGGDTMNLVLVLQDGFTQCYCTRYINVFSIDIHGRMQLLYPTPELAEGNRMTVKSHWTSDTIVPLMESPAEPIYFVVDTPFGCDTYFMIASEGPLPSDIFESDAVRERGPVSAQETALGAVMSNFGTRSRDETNVPQATSEKWKLEKIHVLSAERKRNKGR